MALRIARVSLLVVAAAAGLGRLSVALEGRGRARRALGVALLLVYACACVRLTLVNTTGGRGAVGEPPAALVVPGRPHVGGPPAARDQYSPSPRAARARLSASNMSASLT